MTSNTIFKIEQYILSKQWLTTGLILIVALACAPFDARAQETNPHSPSPVYLEHTISENQLTILASDRIIKLSSYAEGSISVEHVRKGEYEKPSFALNPQTKRQSIIVKDGQSELQLANGKVRAVINKKTLQISFFWKTKLLTKQLLIEKKKSTSGFTFSLDDGEKILGGGERVLGMDRRGYKLPLYNRAHYGYSTESHQMYFSLPLIFSSKSYAILYDNAASGHLDIGKSNPEQLSFESVGGRQAYTVFAADSYPDLLKGYVSVTGSQPLPPRWALGNFASRFGYRSQAEVIDVVDKFEQFDIPLDAVIIDLYWFGKDIKGFMGNLEWDKESFPNPKKMIDSLNAKGIKTILITEPFILRDSSKWKQAVEQSVLAKDINGQPRTYDFYFGNTGLIDVFDDNAAQWFSSIYSDLTKQGVAGVWGDLGEPEVHPDDALHFRSDIQRTVRADEIHNAYGHQWAKLVYQNQISEQPNKRPFIMMRSGFAGSQRFGMIPWTGDVSRSWGGLKPQVELSLQMGLSGLAYTHSDLGGFAGGETFNKELYIRWLQFGAFQPVFRPHAQDNIAPEPVFHDKQTRDIVANFIRLRYQLLPYIYTLAYQNSTTGIPLMRPMFFDNPKDLNLYDVSDQYFWGDSFLVSPVTEPNKTSQTVALPSGVWFDFWSDKRYQGNQSVEIPISLENIPVVVKAGSFIPMINSINTTQDYSSEELTLRYYFDQTVKQSTFEMYEDDGRYRQSISEQKYELLNFKAIQSKSHSNQLTISLKRVKGSYSKMPEKRKIKLMVHNWSAAPETIHFNEKTLSKNNWRYDQTDRVLQIEMDWDHQSTDIIIQGN